MKRNRTELRVVRQPAAPTNPDARRRYIAELRSRYLEGTLDEVLFPEGFEVPDSLMMALFPNLFSRPDLEV
jgi:hypothetical protein